MLYFTSDHHFGHENIIRYCDRPFSSVEEMDEFLIEKWNEVVNPNDEVYYLGDFSLDARSAEVYTSKLNGIKHLVPGNHDFCHSYHKKSRTPERKWRSMKQYQDWGWIVLPEQTFLCLSDFRSVQLCHHPYGNINSVDSEDDQYAKWRPHDDGSWLLCGHIHNKWKNLYHMINVGIDVWDFKPVSEREIVKIIDAQQDKNNY